MKKILLLCAGLLTTGTAFASSGFLGLSTGLSWFFIIILIAFDIVLLVRWWQMTTDVKMIRQHIVPNNPDLPYLVAIGEKEQAYKSALAMMVDNLYPIYCNGEYSFKAEKMDEFIGYTLPEIKRLGLEMPDYVTSGEKFINYMNGLTGYSVPTK